MDDEMNESQKVYIENYYPWVLKIKTFWRFNWWKRLILENREENQYIVVPPSVAKARNLNDIVRAMEDDLKDIKKDTQETRRQTTLIEGIAHTFANMIKGSAKDVEKTYPSKGK